MKKWLLGDAKDALKKSYIWNMIAAGVNASESVVILMIAARTVDVGYTGVLSFAFTIANLMMCIGKYGVRNYQVTDTHKEFSFSDYYVSRIITVLFMLAATIFYLVFAAIGSGYSGSKVFVIFLVVILYGGEAYEDVFLAALQQNGRLDIGAKMFSVRWMITLMVWGILLAIVRNVSVATAAACLVDLMLLLYLTNAVRAVADPTAVLPRKESVWLILRKCLPLCLSTMLAIYLPNAARYAIDAYLSDEIQAYYGYISMPVFVIDLMCFIIFQPILTTMSQEWNDGRYKAFAKRLLGLCGILFGVSVICIMGAYYLGIPVLSLLYATDLSGYKTEFMLLIIGGAALGYIGLFTSVLTIFRRQIYLLGSYAFLSLIGILSFKYTVAVYHVRGAAVENMILLFLLAGVMLGGIFVFMVVAYRTGVRKTPPEDARTPEQHEKIRRN